MFANLRTPRPPVSLSKLLGQRQFPVIVPCFVNFETHSFTQTVTIVLVCDYSTQAQPCQQSDQQNHWAHPRPSRTAPQPPKMGCKQVAHAATSSSSSSPSGPKKRAHGSSGSSERFSLGLVAVTGILEGMFLLCQSVLVDLLPRSTR
jgi:hypothetical protein